MAEVVPLGIGPPEAVTIRLLWRELLEELSASVKAAFRDSGSWGTGCQDFNELLQIFSLMASTLFRNLKEKRTYVQNTWQLDIKNLIYTQISVISFFLNG